MTKPRRDRFGDDVAAYDSGRLGYPDRLYELLVQHCGLKDGTSVLEVGAGTGQATGQLLAHGASVYAVELSADLADKLRSNFTTDRLAVAVGEAEDVHVDAGTFDLVVAATSLHWLRQPEGLVACVRALRPGGWLAAWWNVYGDPTRPDPFHDSLKPILEEWAPELLAEPSAGNPSVSILPYALDVDARMAELQSAGLAETVHEVISWTGRHDPMSIRSLFASFSPWLGLPLERRLPLLDEVERLAQDDFGGVVERPYLTVVYVGRTPI